MAVHGSGQPFKQLGGPHFLQRTMIQRRLQPIRRLGKRMIAIPVIKTNLDLWRRQSLDIEDSLLKLD